MESNTTIIHSHPKANCIICGSVGKPLYTNISDRLFGATGNWNLSQCSNSECGLIWLNPMPIEKDIGKAYQTYYTHGRRAIPWPERLSAWLLYGTLGLLGERRRAENAYLGSIKPGRLLEVGFGDGSRLEQLRASGWQVEGQEVDQVSINNARLRGLTVHEGMLTNCCLQGASYDAIVSSHVIEHVHDPQNMMQECYRLLKPGGILVLYTPNSDSYGFRVFAQNWRGLEPPRHLHIFGNRSMSALIQSTGFSSFQVRTSHAKAGTMLRASLDLQEAGRHTMGASPRLRIATKEIFHLLLARFQQLLGASNGEELIVIAIK